MLKQKATISFLSNVLIHIIGFFSSFFVARFMGAEALGILSSSQAFVNMFGIIGGFGFGLAHFKRVSEGMDLGKCNGTFFTIKTILSFVMFIVTMLVFYSIGWTTGKYPVSENYFSFFWIVAIAFTLGSISQSIQLTFSAKLEVTKNSMVLLSQKLFNTTLKIIIALTGLSVIFLAWTNLFAVLLGIIVSIYLFRNYPISGFDKKIFKSYLSFAIPITLLQFVERVSIYIDKVFIGYFINEEAVGQYAVSQSLTNVFLLSAFMLANLFIPTYSKLHSEKNISAIREFSQRVYKYISLLATPVLFLIIFNAESIILIIYGDAFTRSSIILRILALQTLFYFYLQPFSHLFIGTDKPKLVAKYGIISAIVNIVLNFVLIPKQIGGIPLAGLGEVGAAYALLISGIIRLSLFRLSAMKLFNLGINMSVVKHFITALLSNSVSYYLFYYIFDLSLLFSLIFSMAVSLGLFFLISILIGEIKNADILYYLDMINFVKVKNSMKNEFNHKK